MLKLTNTNFSAENDRLLALKNIVTMVQEEVNAINVALLMLHAHNSESDDFTPNEIFITLPNKPLSLYVYSRKRNMFTSREPISMLQFYNMCINEIPKFTKMDFLIDYTTLENAYKTLCLYVCDETKRFGNIINKTLDENGFVNFIDGVYDIRTGKRANFLFPFGYQIQMPGTTLIPKLASAAAKMAAKLNNEFELEEDDRETKDTVLTAIAQDLKDLENFYYDEVDFNSVKADSDALAEALCECYYKEYYLDDDDDSSDYDDEFWG